MFFDASEGPEAGDFQWAVVPGVVLFVLSAMIGFHSLAYLNLDRGPDTPSPIEGASKSLESVPLALVRAQEVVVFVIGIPSLGGPTWTEDDRSARMADRASNDVLDAIVHEVLLKEVRAVGF